jgi:hypothetical protein
MCTIFDANSKVDGELIGYKVVGYNKTLKSVLSVFVIGYTWVEGYNKVDIKWEHTHDQATFHCFFYLEDAYNLKREIEYEIGAYRHYSSQPKKEHSDIEYRIIKLRCIENVKTGRANMDNYKVHGTKQVCATTVYWDGTFTT